MVANPYRSLPSIDAVVAAPALAALHNRALVVSCAREALDAARASIAAGGEAIDAAGVVADVARRVSDALRLAPRRVINATGVILHTNLGRAPLPQEALDAMAEASRGYSALELDEGSGRRGSRHALLEPALRALLGCDAAIAVNNNASAVLLALSALAAGRDVIISRGQLVEIGGGFRIPDVLRQSRARLVEVGTTNRTRIEDYAAAITPRTGAVLRVHASNFKIVGFAEQARLEDLSALARAHNVLLLDDVGSGSLLDPTAYGLAPEPRPQDSIAAGADVVLFSGDKLLGGPQAGIAAGRADAIAKMKRHPLARAVRLDKASIAGLSATLRIYLEGDPETRIPVWRMIAMPLDELARRAERIAGALGGEALDGTSMIGGGSLPEESLPSRVIALRSGTGATSLAARLREGGVIARVAERRVLLDVRTVAPDEDDALIAACRDALA